MTHTEISFENLSQALSRCGEKLATEAIAEIRAALNQVAAQAATASDVDTLLAPIQNSVDQAHTARREKAAARRAAKKAQKPTSSEAPSPSPSEEGRGGAAGAADAPIQEAITPEMVKYLRRCPDQYMLAVLNSYIHLILTGHLVHTADDHRYLDNFITMARTMGIIDNPVPPTADDAIAFFCDNPALPLPRAKRRAIERLRRKQLRKSAR